MSVAVVDADGDQAHGGVKPLVERFALVGRPVVSDFDHIRRPDLGRRQEFVLGILAQVAEEHRSQAATFDCDRHTAGVPAHGRHTGLRCRGPQDAPLELAEAPAPSREPLSDLGPGVPEVVEDALVRLPARLPDDDRLRPVYDACQSPDVVCVIVREDEQFQPADAQPFKTGFRRLRITADVDHRDAVSVANEQSVALSDIAGGDLPIAGQGEHPTERSTAQAPRVDPDARDQSCSRDRGHDAPPRSETRKHEHRDRSDRAGAQGDAYRPAEPWKAAGRQRAHRVGDLCDPGRRNPGQPHHRLAQHGRDREQETGCQAEHRRYGRGRFGENVGSHSVQRQGRREHDEYGLAHHLGRQRYGHQHGEGARHPTGEGARERTCEHEQSRRGEHRQGEPVVA
jgi:hypothetical protein